jgi:tetratricopeptide (TPR) repeat protein
LVEEPPEGQVDALTVLDAIVDWLAAEAAQRPVLLVLDDLHWAAKPTLKALLHLVRGESLGHLLIVGTYRDTDLDRKHPLAEVLADLHREEAVERLLIRGLDANGVEAFVEAARGDELDDAGRELAQQLGEQTQGNPFFVGQVLRHRAESGAVEEVDGRWVAAEGAGEFQVPEGVREVVGRRVSRLSDQAGALLTVAAVTGPEFDAAIVAEVAEQPTAQALDGFDEAAGARLVLETEVPGRLRFAHAMVRQTLADELSTLRRLHLHQQIGLALEGRYGDGDGDGAISELAHHFAEAAAVGEGERAARYSERAALQALDRGAPGQAAELLDRALELLPADEADPDGRGRDRLYAELANCLYALWDLERIEEAARAWLALAKEHGHYGMRVNATMWLVISWLWRITPEASDLSEVAETLRIDPDGVEGGDYRRFSWSRAWCATDAPGLRALLLGKLAYVWTLELPLEALGDDLPAGDPLGLAEEACRVAGASTDDDIVKDTSWDRMTTLTAWPDAGRLLREAERTAAAGYEVGGGGRIELAIAQVRLGQLDDLRTLGAEMMRIAERTGDRIIELAHWNTRANEALVRGRLEDARLANERLLAAGEDQPIFQLAGAFMTVALLLADGRPDEARPIAEALDAGLPFDVSQLVGAAAAAQGDLETVRTTLAAWHSDGCPVPLNFALPGRLWGLAECAYVVGDADAAARLYQPLTPYDGQLLFFGLVFSPASAAYTLGLLAETMGDRDRALGHYAEALEFEERIGAVVFAARTRQALDRIE